MAKSFCSHQVLEHDSPLQSNLNLGIDELRRRIPDQLTTIYCYVVKSVEWFGHPDPLVQTGSGPNIQGGLITLCTCRPDIRAYPKVEPGVWIAGFTSRRHYPCNVLFYLMRIEHTFPSQRDLWSFLDEEVRLIKSARKNPLGDLYQPRNNDGDAHHVDSYHPPMQGHSHMKQDKGDCDWHKDIHSPRSKMLVGDPELSFVWTRPMFERKHNLQRHKMEEYIKPLEFLAEHLRPYRP